MVEISLIDSYKALVLNKAQEAMVIKVREKIIKRDKPTTEETMNQLFSDVLTSTQKAGVYRLFKREFGKKVVLNHFNRRQGVDIREIMSFFMRGERLFNQSILYAALHESDLKIFLLIEQIPLMTGLPHFDPKKKKEMIITVGQHLRILFIKPIQTILNQIGSIRNIAEYEQKLQYLVEKQSDRPLLKKLIRGICLFYKQKSAALDYIQNISMSEKADLKTLFKETMKIFYYYVYNDEKVTSREQDATTIRHAEKITSVLLEYPLKVKELTQMSVDETNLFVQSMVLISETPSGNAVVQIRNFMKTEGQSLKGHFERFQKRVKNTY